jgi:hypothetical protein
MRKHRGKASAKNPPKTSKKQPSRPDSVAKTAKKVEFELSEEDMEKVSGGAFTTACAAQPYPVAPPKIYPTASVLCKV